MAKSLSDAVKNPENPISGKRIPGLAGVAALVFGAFAVSFAGILGYGGARYVSNKGKEAADKTDGLSMGVLGDL